MTRFAQSASVLNPAPFLIGSGEVRSERGTAAHGELIGIPYTAADLMALPSSRAAAVVREAVDLAIDRGAQIVGLGAYTSIVTDNAVAIGEFAVPITTGNAFTAAASLDAIRRALANHERPSETATVAVVGAGGAIGRAIAVNLACEVGRLFLVGRPGRPTAPRLIGTRDAIVHRWGDDHAQIEVCDDAGWAARQSDVVITATSSPGTVLNITDIRPGTIVCDVAQPANVPADLAQRQPGVVHFDGGIVALPGGLDFGLAHGLPRGLTYACMAETMLLALLDAEGSWDSALVSHGEDLDIETVARLGELAGSHGFSLADSRTWRGGRA